MLVWSAATNTVSGQQIALGQERFNRRVSYVDAEVSAEISVGFRGPARYSRGFGSSPILTQIQEQSTRGVELHLRTELEDGPNHDSPSSKLAADPTRDLLHAITYPTMLGDSSMMFKGVQPVAVLDHTPEIAKKPNLSNP